MPIRNQVEAIQQPPEVRGLDAQRALALGLEFIKRCFEAQTLDDFFLLITNDIRVIIEFDRSVLITHLGGESRFVASANQPSIEKKSKLYELLTELAVPLKSLNKAILLNAQAATQDLPDEISAETKDKLQNYLDFVSCSFLLCVPLRHRDITVGHLMMEFFDEKPPDHVSVVTLLNLAPMFAAALQEKWLLSKLPNLTSKINPENYENKRTAWLRRNAYFVLAAFAASFAILFLIPFSFDVGGEAEVIPRNRHVAFCKIDGLTDKVFAAEGESVKEGKILASLDPRELQYKIKTAETQFEIHTKEMTLLRDSAGEDPSKLVESKIAELKRNAAWQELDFYKWQQQFLNIEAPLDGIILTRDIESLTGKKLRAGEPFCELVAPGDLAIDVFVPEDRIAHVHKGMTMTAFLSANPRKGHELKVQEIAPIAEATPRLGNIYRVRGYFPEAPGNILVGMKGIGRIHVKNTSLWFIISDRLLSKWQRWSLYL